VVNLSSPACQGSLPVTFSSPSPQRSTVVCIVVIEHRSRRLIHCNVTAHRLRLDAATVARVDWTAAAIRVLLHDRDSIFAAHLDASIAKLGSKYEISAAPVVEPVLLSVRGSICSFPISLLGLRRLFLNKKCARRDSNP